MSGTSVDGLDMALVEFKQSEKGTWKQQILHTASIDYTAEQRQKLKDSIFLSAPDLYHLDYLYGEWLGEQVKAFCKKYPVQPDYVASHGHTVFHEPERNVTVQIGDGQVIAEVSRISTIYDFRSLDVQLGGQGAPLVPLGDRDLLSDYDFCLNLGGIANVSFEYQGKRVAYDIGPANMLLNYICQELNIAYDKGGRIAQEGSLIPFMLEDLSQLEYYQQAFPKSTGIEWFLAEVKPIVDSTEGSPQDKLHTAVLHLADLYAKDILQFANADQQLIVTGGGAKNDFLITHLRAKLLPQVKVVVPDEELIDFKEAMVFAYLGLKRILGEPNCLASVTGARRDSCGGRLVIL